MIKQHAVSRPLRVMGISKLGGFPAKCKEKLATTCSSSEQFDIILAMRPTCPDVNKCTLEKALNTNHRASFSGLSLLQFLVNQDTLYKKRLLSETAPC